MAKKHRPVVVPRPDRVRSIEGTAFGWIDAGLWRRDWLGALSPEELAVYVFLCLVADRRGVSFYRRDRIAHHLGLDLGSIDRARVRLRKLDLVAYQPFSVHSPDGFHQVLALPDVGPPEPLSALAELWRPKSI